jgi:hypothetical protein
MTTIARPPYHHPRHDSAEFGHLYGAPYTVVIESSRKLHHTVFDGAPCDWSRERGATHTLWCGEGPGQGTRPARLLQTVLYVGVDEGPEETIVWEKWKIRHYLDFRG